MTDTETKEPELSCYDTFDAMKELIGAGWSICVKPQPMMNPQHPNLQFVVNVFNTENTFSGVGKTLGSAMNKAVHHLNNFIEQEYKAQQEQIDRLNQLRVSVLSNEQKAARDEKWKRDREEFARERGCVVIEPPSQD